MDGDGITLQVVDPLRTLFPLIGAAGEQFLAASGLRFTGFGPAGAREAGRGNGVLTLGSGPTSRTYTAVQLLAVTCCASRTDRIPPARGRSGKAGGRRELSEGLTVESKPPIT